MEKVVVSLTSFPAAIKYAPVAIKSILRGSVLPDKLVLYLTFDQFKGISLPEELISLEKEYDIFEIRDYPNEIRSYRKLIPALRDFPEDVIVTIDDDVYYDSDMLKRLLSLHAKYPDYIIAHRAKRLKLDKPYKKWSKYRWYDFIFKKDYAALDNLFTGVGGVLYPPGCLKRDMLDEKLFTRIAPTTDDIWFWAAAVANDTKIMPVPFGYNKPKGAGKPKEISLKTYNFKSGVDNNSIALKAILEAYPSIRQKIEKGH